MHSRQPSRTLPWDFKIRFPNDPLRFLICLPFAIFLAGCTSEPQFRRNQVEVLKQQRQHLDKGEQFTDQQLLDVGSSLNALFGTPNDPYFYYPQGPDDPLQELVRMEHLRMAAGPVSSDRDGKQEGLYREHCAQCHGVTGNGAGPTSAVLNPYPRDFRLGQFKFKSTPLRVPPTDDDLKRILVEGIPGTAMPSFRVLPDDELDALVDYVKYLTIRGETERKLLAELYDFDEERLLQLDDEDSLYDRLDLLVGECFLGVTERWVGRDRRVTRVPAVPADFFESLDQRFEQGKQLFFGKANCAQCHGETGLGDGQTENYDAWTNDWVKGAKVDPEDPESYGPFVEAGAFPPRKIRPRNLRLRVFRGGDQPADLYRRIFNGIEGTPMPGATTLSEDEVWALVAYVLGMASGKDASP